MEVDSKIENVEARIKKLELILLGFTGAVLAFFSISCLMSSLSIGRFEQIFADMLGDKPLPGITQLVINLGQTGLASAFSVFVPFGAFVVLAIKRNQTWPWVCAICVLIFLMFLNSCIILALFMPLISIITEMNGSGF